MRFRDHRRTPIVFVALSVLSVVALAAPSVGAAETGLAGIVYGQDQQGKHLGTVAGAKLELLDADGKPAASAESNPNGYYRFTNLKPGTYRYKLAAQGYATDDAGRGLVVPAAGAFAHHFVLTLGGGTAGKPNDAPAPPTQPVALSGHVWKQTPSGKLPIAEAAVALKNAAGGPVLVVRTDRQGAYALTPKPGAYRASAQAAGFAVQVEPKTLELAAGDKAVLDFTFSVEPNAADRPPTRDVYAIIAVQPSDVPPPQGSLPTARFKIADQEPIPASVRPLTPEELKSTGLGSDGRSTWSWFEAQTQRPLVAGTYHVEASWEQYHPGSSDAKPIAPAGLTYYDVTLRALKPTQAERDAAPPPAAKIEAPQPLLLHGRVYGQTDGGEHLGVVAEAKLVLTDDAGKTLAEATSNADGYYRIPQLAPGTTRYRLSASGYRSDEAGRGLSLPPTGAHVHDFVLTKGDAPSKPTEEKPAQLAGHVYRQDAGEAKPRPIAGAMVAVRAASGSGPALALRTAADGGYRLTLPAGKYRASASVAGLEAPFKPKEIELAAGDAGTLDFTFTAPADDDRPAGQVYALVAVQPAVGPNGSTAPSAAATPVVSFVSEGSSSQAAPTKAEVRLLSPAELAGLGLTPDSSAGSVWRWYHAESKTPLPAGDYHVDATLADYHPGRSETKRVVADGSTWFDVTLRAVKPAPAADAHPPQFAGKPTLLHGRVYGQDPQGNHLGSVPGAKLELTDAAGNVVASAAADDAGYYRIAPLMPGTFRYRLSADGYRDEDARRGLAVPHAGEHVHNFVLTFGAPKPTQPTDPPGRLFGQVRLERPEGTMPLPGAMVAVRPRTSGRPLVTYADAQGRYSLPLPAGAYQAAAVAGRWGSTTPLPVDVSAGQDKERNFVFTETSTPAEVPLPDEPRAPVLAFIAVERNPLSSSGPQADAPPQVEFVRESAELAELTNPVVVNVRPLSEIPEAGQLKTQRGIGADLPANEPWQWFVAVPTAQPASGRYSVEARLAGFESDVSDAKGVHRGLATIFELRLPRVRPEVEVLVQGKDDQPIGGASVRLINKDLGQRLADGAALTTDAAGRAVTKLEPGMGRYNVLVSNPSYRPIGEEVLVDRERMTLKYRFFKQGEVRTLDVIGTVLRCGGSDPAAPAEPLAGARVTLRPTGGAAATTPPSGTTNAEGRFLLPQVAEGEYEALVEGPGCGSVVEPLTVKPDMPSPTYHLDPRDEQLENALRLLLTEGWGRTPAQRALADQYYKQAVAKDPKTSRPEFAMALALMKAGDYAGADARLYAAVTKKTDDSDWDRACEARIFLAMFRGDVRRAAQEAEALAVRHYADRKPCAAGEDTAELLGKLCAMIDDPWSAEARGIDAAALRKRIEEALKSPLREAFLRGVAEAEAEYDRIADAKQELFDRGREAIDRQRKQAAAEAAAKTAVIQQELNKLPAEAQAAQQAALERLTEIERQHAPLFARRRQLAAAAAPLVAERDQILRCLARDRAQLQGGGAGGGMPLSMPGGGDAAVLAEIREHEQELQQIAALLPQVAGTPQEAELAARRNEIIACLAQDRAKVQGAAAGASQTLPGVGGGDVLEEIREHERDLLVIGRQLAQMQADDAQLQTACAVLETEYERLRARHAAHLQGLQAKQNALVGEQNRVDAAGRGPTTEDPAVKQALADYDHKQRDLNTYCSYPLEARRQEQLELASTASAIGPATSPPPALGTPEGKPTARPGGAAQRRKRTPVQEAALKAAAPELKKRNFVDQAEPIDDAELNAALPGIVVIPVPASPASSPSASGATPKSPAAPSDETSEENPNKNYFEREFLVVHPGGRQEVLSGRGAVYGFLRQNFPRIRSAADAERAARAFVCIAEGKYPELTFGPTAIVDSSRLSEGGHGVRVEAPVTAGGSGALRVNLKFTDDWRWNGAGIRAPRVGASRNDASR